VSHDLRAPLRHIHSFAALLKEIDGTLLSGRGRDFVERILKSSDFGGRLVDDLLAFSQMGRAALDVRPIDMSMLVREVVESEKLSARGDIKWVIGTLPDITGDATFLRLALQNLISNAIKFTQNEPQSIIEIGSQPGAGKFTGFIVFFVKDNGAGFDMAYADKLFQVFQRLHRDEDFAGTGIGLANVRRIVERHGGSVYAEGAPGEGATFYMVLPREYRAPSGSRAETLAATVARMASVGELVPPGGVRKKEARKETQQEQGGSRGIEQAALLDAKPAPTSGKF